MRRIAGFLLIAGIAGAAATGQAAPPRVGFVYPAGGKAGDTFEIEVGGQYLAGPMGLYFSGGGISAEVLEHDKLPPAAVLSDYRDRLRTIRDEFRGLEQGSEVPVSAVMPEIRDLLASVDLTEKSVRQIADFARRRSDPKRQLNNQIGETVRLRVTIDSQAEPGMRYARLRTAQGLANPVRFFVGNLPEYREESSWQFSLPDYLDIETAPEPEDDPWLLRGAIEPPATVNGQILPGEVDEFVVSAKKDEQLVIAVAARNVVPYLADAVPGWFQAVVSVRDPRGRELAFSDDYRFDPDPVLFYKIPRDGNYRVRIHDSIYRGREDFVYRITVGELPFLTGITPMGGQAGSEVDLVFSGGNLTEFERTRYVLPDKPGIIRVAAAGEAGHTHSLPFHVGDAPEDAEREDNDRLGAANEIPMPGVINGVIGRRGDLDYFRVNGTGNRPMTFEVFARRLGSPLDASLVVFDDDGKEIARNDDFENPAAGLTTHHADPRITIPLPDNGRCFVRVADTQHQGDSAYTYRLRVSQGPPDTPLRVTPSSNTVRPGGTARVTVHALRLGAFDGPIRIELADAPEGYTMRPATIGEGEESATVGIAVPSSPTEEPQRIVLRGFAIEEGKEVAELEFVPSEEMTQAFITPHIVPVDALLIDVVESPSPAP